MFSSSLIAMNNLQAANASTIQGINPHVALQGLQNLSNAAYTYDSRMHKSLEGKKAFDTEVLAWFIHHDETETVWSYSRWSKQHITTENMNRQIYDWIKEQGCGHYNEWGDDTKMLFKMTWC